MKIALLAPLRFPIREPYAGGLEVHTHLLAEGLRARGHEVTLFAHPQSESATHLRPYQAPEDGALLGSFRVYRKALSDIGAGDFDLLHNNSIHWLPPALAASLPFPVVTTLHTPPYRTHRWSAWRSRRAANHHYVSISDFLAGQWAPLIGPAETIHNGIDLARFPFTPTAVPGTAIWYGRIVPEKGTHHAIAAARFAGFQLRIAGPVGDQDYFERAVAPELSGGVEYLGHIGQQRLVELVGRSSVGLVTPVWEEPFGLVTAEMLACGTPVAAFDSGAVREVLSPSCSAIVARGDEGALARVLSEVGKKPRRACRERATAFSAEQMIVAYECFYKRVTTSKNTLRK